MILSLRREIEVGPQRNLHLATAEPTPLVPMTIRAANPRLHWMATGSGQYRQWAAEARRKAEAASAEPTLRQSYLHLAAAYDKLADTPERSPADPAKAR